MTRCTALTTRNMEERDLDEVEAMERLSFPMPWSKALFRAEIKQPCGSCWVMTPEENSERVIGYICFRNIGEESELLKICICPERRNLGLGRELMRVYTTFSIEKGARTFHLEVDPGNESALRLYRRFSYETVGVRPRFYCGTRDALRMMRRV
jgi:[ribosomal protein S18]-alanine N-acetyltransferase